MKFFRYRSGQPLSRAMSVAVAIALVLLLTPCCELFAASYHAHEPEDAATAHSHDDGNAPSSDEHCAPWLEQVFMPAGDTAVPLSAPSGVAAPLLYEQSSIPAPQKARVVPHAGAPPPARALYLLTSRLLI